MVTSMHRHVLNWSSIDETTWQKNVQAALGHYENKGTWTERAEGHSLGMLFFNPSLRTRTSMELAAAQLGAHSTTLTPGNGTWGFAWEPGAVMDGEAAEHVHDAVKVLSRYYDALGTRIFASKSDYEQDRSDRLLQSFAKAAEVPIISLESAFYHPCQALGDAALINTEFNREVRGRKFVLAWTHHPKPLPMAVPNSAVLMASRLGMDVTVARPESHTLDDGVMDRAQTFANQNGGRVQESSKLPDAAEGADVVYAKSWGGPLLYTDPKKEEEIRTQATDWRITKSLMDNTNDGIFMHCLPVRRNVVVDDAVMDGPQARHLLQAEFRLHAQKAILEYIWNLR